MRDYPDLWPTNIPWPSRSDDKHSAPEAEELNRLRKDAGEGDANAVAFLRNHQDAMEALERWRDSQAK